MWLPVPFSIGALLRALVHVLRDEHPVVDKPHPTLMATSNFTKALDRREFRTIEPKILYFGNPVALISSINEDGSANLAPISSFWELGWTMTLGLLNDTKTLANLSERPECVVNIPSPDLWEKVEKLAPLTGRDPVPEEKRDRFRFEKDKFGAAAFTTVASELVSAPRAIECPVQLEAMTRAIHPLVGEPRLKKLGGGATIEVEILRVHVRTDFILDDHYIDPAKWQPLIYNFRHYFGLGEELGMTFRAEK